MGIKRGSETLVSFSTLLELTNFLTEEQKNILIQHLLKGKTKDVFLPISIFNEKISCLESISKYLREELNQDFNSIGKIFNITLRQVIFFFLHSLDFLEHIFCISVAK